MPGGVDMHTHMAGPKVNAARALQARGRPRGKPSVPTTSATGHLYAGLGYTTAFDAAVAPLGARQAHEELHDTPIIDKGFYVLLGNNHYVLEQIACKDPAQLRAFVGWIVNATKAYAVKVVNPGERRSVEKRDRAT